MYRRELKKLHDTKSGQAAETTHELKWHYFTILFMNTVMIPQPTLSNVPAASSVLRTRNLEDGPASTNVSINDNDNDEFSEGVSNECQIKKNLGTKRKINFQEEALRLKKRKITFMKESQADEDEDYTFLMSLLPSIKNWTAYKGFLNRVARRIQTD